MRTLSLALLFLAGATRAEEAGPVQIDFETSESGKVPKGWAVAKTGDGEGSVWAVVADKSAPKGPKVLAQTAESPRATFNLCVATDTGFGDVDVSVAFKANAGKIDPGGGIVWRYRDENNYYVARYNPLESNYRVYHVVDGKRTPFGGKEGLKAKAGEWHTLRVQMVGDRITCSLNGKVEIEAKDRTCADGGKVGLWTKADAQTSFDDFHAKEFTK
jgi:hypothetical protein